MSSPPSSAELLKRNVFDLFDPLQQQQQQQSHPNRPSSWPTKLNEAKTITTATPPFVTPNNEPIPIQISPNQSLNTSTNSFPIKLRLKLTTFPEIKSFTQLVQRIRNENQSKQV